jgi:predicted enzyme involved in methoxymalonyl-ACP biosynthesis
MELRFAAFHAIGLPRIVQLINKTNQFNLTTRRYTDVEVQAVLADASRLHLQFRLLDRFGDNGVIGLVIGNLNADHEMFLDTWLMSCRVLGAIALIGFYRPTAKNVMVKDHYQRLGFRLTNEANGETTWRLDLEGYRETEVAITIVEEIQ